MTKKKTSLEKLDTRLETVKDLSSALLSSRWKWREIQKIRMDLENLIDHKCGFCVLAQTKARSLDKCTACPEVVKGFCLKLQGRLATKMYKVEAEIVGVLDFLKGLKLDDC